MNKFINYLKNMIAEYSTKYFYYRYSYTLENNNHGLGNAYCKCPDGIFRTEQGITYIMEILKNKYNSECIAVIILNFIKISKKQYEYFINE